MPFMMARGAQPSNLKWKIVIIMMCVNWLFTTI